MLTNQELLTKIEWGSSFTDHLPWMFTSIMIIKNSPSVINNNNLKIKPILKPLMAQIF